MKSSFADYMSNRHPEYSIGRWSHIDVQFSVPFTEIYFQYPNQDDVRELILYWSDHRFLARGIQLQVAYYPRDVETAYFYSRLYQLIRKLTIRTLRLERVSPFDHTSTPMRLTQFASEICSWNFIIELNLSYSECSSESEDLPPSLTWLSLPPHNVPLNHLILPSTLKHLQFDDVWNQPVEGWPQLPSSIQTIHVGFHFRSSFSGLVLPSSLTQLQLGSCYYTQSLNDLILPDGFRSLRLVYWNRPVTELCRLPSSMTELVFLFDFNQPIDEMILPSSLTTLVLSGQFNQPVNRLVLPDSLRLLRFGDNFNQGVDELKLPSSLTELHFGTSFNQPIDRLLLPSSLREIDFGRGKFNQPIPATFFPHNLRVLKLSQDFDQPIAHWKLPSTVKSIEFGKCFTQSLQSLPHDYWPISIERVTFYQLAIKSASAPISFTRRQLQQQPPPNHLGLQS